MNQRIRLLAEQSDATVLGTISGGRQYTFLEQDLKKFTQLIVQECISVLDKEIYLAIREDGEQTQIDVILLEHFGVEE